MVIDIILNRKDGTLYNAKTFYNDILQYGAISFGITSALDSGSDSDIKKELCKYILENDYNPDICNYINTIKWI